MKPKLNEVIGVGHKKRTAPECNVRFRCRICGGEDVLNAYLGVPICPSCKIPLEPLSVVRDAPPPDPVREHALDRETYEGRGIASTSTLDRAALNLQPPPGRSTDSEGGADPVDWIQWSANGDAPL